ncbi:hypothetical protein [Streptomyces sp. WAC06614]|uniref:hypothetical protein n=1 Tax=Streptomyces sp. WAC06614 TaxID=2487416 RepID=UPI000F78256C|nr:hypothetical protein [Streptomyces sp. WAC06614]RSS83682.1 hypothetical protein EF918_03050 [Streptomyces sp. WAC06614]
MTEALVAFDSAATGASDRGAFSIEVTDEAGELVGGLTARTWGGLCGIELSWVREDRRKDGWGSRTGTTTRRSPGADLAGRLA